MSHIMFTKWCKNAYCDGIRELYESKNKPKQFAFWLLTMILMVTGSAYFIAHIIIKYREKPTVTMFSTIPSTNLEMPQFLLCYNGGLNASALKLNLFSDNLILILSGTSAMSGMNESSVLSAKNELEKYLQKNNLDIIEFYQKFSFTCQDMVDIVYPAGNSINFTNIACVNMTVLPSPDYGSCLLYNQSGFQHWPGVRGGVRFYLKSIKDSLVSMYPDLAMKSDRSSDFVVSIEKNFFIPTYRSYLVPMNMKTELALNTKNYVRLPDATPSCNTASSHNSNDCFNRCYVQQTLDNCGCIPFRYYNRFEDKNRTICTNFDEYFCEKLNYSKTFKCQSICKASCDEWIFDATAFYAPIIPVASEEFSTSLWIGYHSMHFTRVSVKK